METETLVRKQFFLSPDNVAKIERLAKQFKGSSVAKVVRDAIDAYDPEGSLEDREKDELIAIAHSKVKEAISKTKKTIETVDFCLENLSTRRAE